MADEEHEGGQRPPCDTNRPHKNPRESLTECRAQIEHIDDQLLALLAERQQVVKKIGQVKNELGLAVKDDIVEKKIIDRARSKARSYGIAENMAEEFAYLCIRYAVASQDA